MDAIRILSIAAADLGIVEQGAANHGAQVEAWLKEAGAKPGDPWCASWAYSVLRRAGLKEKIAGAASCSKLVAWARATNRVVTKPQPGDLVVFKWDPDPFWDHVGYVEKVVSLGPVCTLRTIEGNTSPATGRRDGVYRRLRVVKRDRLCFIRP